MAQTTISTVHFVTGNQNKLNEVTKILGDDFPFKVDSVNYDVPEYQGDEQFIVRKKVEYAFAHLNKPVVVEDTSFQIGCLNGLPGPYVKHFLDKLGPDGLYKLTKAWDNKSCRIVCLVGFIYDKTECEIFEGSIEGQLVSPRGTNGFGFDSCFQPNGFSKTLAELSSAEKDQISHRGLAFRSFKDYVIKNLKLRQLSKTER